MKIVIDIDDRQLEQVLTEEVERGLKDAITESGLDVRVRDVALEAIKKWKMEIPLFRLLQNQEETSDGHRTGSEVLGR